MKKLFLLNLFFSLLLPLNSFTTEKIEKLQQTSALQKIDNHAKEIIGAEIIATVSLAIGLLGNFIINNYCSPKSYKLPFNDDHETYIGIHLSPEMYNNEKSFFKILPNTLIVNAMIFYGYGLYKRMQLKKQIKNYQLIN